MNLQNARHLIEGRGGKLLSQTKHGTGGIRTHSIEMTGA